jgi:ABC-type transport system involved in multi-copper enzyme maturation permease subunit
MGRVITIARHNFKESVRERVLYNLIVFAFLLIGAAVLFGRVSVGVADIILVNLGLTAIAVFGLFMAIFIGIGLVSKEIERRTVYSLLSKPVRRWEFIVGKYSGLLFTLFVNTAMMTAGFYLALYYQKRTLERSDALPLEAIYLILLQLAVVVAVALVFSCISTPILSAAFTFCVYIIGNLLNDVRWFGEETKSTVVRGVTTALYYLLPNFTNFNVITQTAHGGRISGHLILSNSLYALLYIAILISAAILIFEEREFR